MCIAGTKIYRLRLQKQMNLSTKQPFGIGSWFTPPPLQFIYHQKVSMNGRKIISFKHDGKSNDGSLLFKFWRTSVHKKWATSTLRMICILNPEQRACLLQGAHKPESKLWSNSAIVKNYFTQSRNVYDFPVSTTLQSKIRIVAACFHKTDLTQCLKEGQRKISNDKSLQDHLNLNNSVHYLKLGRVVKIHVIG